MKGQPPIRAVSVSLVALMVAIAGLALSGCAAPGPAAKPESSDGPALGDIQTRSLDGMAMVYVPVGQFEMGSSDTEVEQAWRACTEAQEEVGGKPCKRSGFEDEQPAHKVALDAFWIDQTEVTNAQFAAFLNEQGNQAQGNVTWLEPGKYGKMAHVNGEFRPFGGYDDYPVIEVSWYGAAAYCARVGGRLPTEAEWEYAARGPEGRTYPWGDTFDGTRLNYRDASFTFQSFGPDTAFDDGYARWAPVGSYPDGASWCGALDMAGNVWEWVHDRYDEDYYSSSPAQNPEGPSSEVPYNLRVRRGGSWYDPDWGVRSAYRRGENPSSYRIHWVGFRCVVPASPSPT
jgi:formylglycine-generating enzyme required for sulfatase activity